MEYIEISYNDAKLALITGEYAECKRIMKEHCLDYVVYQGHDVFMCDIYNHVHAVSEYFVCENNATAKILFKV